MKLETQLDVDAERGAHKVLSLEVHNELDMRSNIHAIEDIIDGIMETLERGKEQFLDLYVTLRTKPKEGS